MREKHQEILCYLGILDYVLVAVGGGVKLAGAPQPSAFRKISKQSDIET